MVRRVILQPEAQDDLRAILAYIAQDSFLSANRLVDRLERASMELGEAALRYPVLSRYRNNGIRRRVVGSYNIFFRASSNVVDILRVVHSARDSDQIFLED
jgi:toxin ParE1/3/4